MGTMEIKITCSSREITSNQLMAHLVQNFFPVYHIFSFRQTAWSNQRFAPSLLASLAVYNCARVHSGNGDRKSTRLNSSHVRISYAVFCLKKKKNILHETSCRS